MKAGLPLLWLAGMLAAAAIPGAACAQQNGNAAQQTKTLGFVMTSFRRMLYPGQQDCPSGFVERGIQGLLPNLSAAERSRLSRPERAAERERLDKIIRGVTT